MKDDETTGTFVTNQCGLHVHVQAPRADDFEHLERGAAAKLAIDVKKELATILIVYKDGIARLHPPCRRRAHASAEYQIQSNRLGLIKNGLAMFPGDLINDTIDTTTRSWLGVGCSTRAVRSVTSIPAVRDAMKLATEEKMIKFMHWPAVDIKSMRSPIGRMVTDIGRSTLLTCFATRRGREPSSSDRRGGASTQKTSIDGWTSASVSCVSRV